MGRVLKREAAKRDLIAQWVWYAENASIEIADRFLAAVEDTLAILSTQPESGALASFQKIELRNIRRSLVSDRFESILLFYLPLEDGIDLVRVVHGRRNLELLAQEGFFR